MQRAFAFDHQEVIHHAAVAEQGLRPNTALAGDEVIRLYFWNEPLQTARERRLAHGAEHLLGTFLVVLGREFPEAGVSKYLGQIAPAKVRLAVAFAFETEHCVWPGVNASIHHAREVHTEERKRWIGHRVNEVLDQV